MRFKYYLTTNNLGEAVKYYSEIFNGKIEKQDSHHAKINFYDKLTFLVHESRNSQPKKDGYLIIRFDKNERHLYDQTKERLIKQGGRFHIDENKASWGTTFSEFTDPFGYTWDLEIDTE